VVWGIGLPLEVLQVIHWSMVAPEDVNIVDENFIRPCVKKKLISFEQVESFIER
jgi:hypothetical protein